MRYFQLKKQTDSSSSWNSRPKPSLPAPPISCGLNCRCCRLQEAKNGGNGETTNKMKHQTKKQEKHAKTHKGYKFSESSRQNRSTENGGPCGCHQAYNPRSLGQNMQHRGNDKKSGVLYSHVLLTCAYCSRLVCGETVLRARLSDFPTGMSHSTLS